MGRATPCVVVCEGRTTDLPGLKLLLASLQRHAPDWDVLAHLSEPLRALAADELIRINGRTRVFAYDGPEDWTCKPFVLRRALDEAGGRRVLWIDTDILIVGPLSSLASVDEATLIIAQETNPDDNQRVQLRQQTLGLPAAPPRATTVSSCVIGVTDAHRDLLHEWGELMRHPAFLREQTLPPRERRLFVGDQEVWEQVLCQPARREVPLRWLMNGAAMVQATYTPFVVPSPPPTSDRPMFLHATGNLKPWRTNAMRAAQEMFPYFTKARPYLSLLSPAERQHFRRRSVIAWAWQHFFGGFRTYRAVRRHLQARKNRRLIAALQRPANTRIGTLTPPRSLHP